MAIDLVDSPPPAVVLPTTLDGSTMLPLVGGDAPCRQRKCAVLGRPVIFGSFATDHTPALACSPPGRFRSISFAGVHYVVDTFMLWLKTQPDGTKLYLTRVRKDAAVVKFQATTN
jgi:hypothetical protein